MKLRFYVDPELSGPHIARHDVRKEEVREVLANPLEDRPAPEGARVALGRTRNGRFLRVVYTPGPEPNSVFVITAFEIRGKPLFALRRRMRRRLR